MKVNCKREQFLQAFQIAASVVPSRSPKPILQNVKLEVTDSGGVFIATDMEIGIRIEVSDLDVQEPGEVILPVGRFGSILRESTDETLSIESDSQATIIKGQRSEFNLPSKDPVEFPEVLEFREESYIEVPARLLKESIRRTLFATDTESNRYALGGILLEIESDQLITVGTDGRRLAKMTGPCQIIGSAPNQDEMTIVPAKSMQLIERALSDADAEIQVALKSNSILLKTARVTIYSRLVEGRFPKWRDVFPERKESSQIDLTAGPFLSTLRQASIIASDESRGIDFLFENGNMILSGTTAEIGQSRVELPIPYSGEKVMITLDHRFVADFLKVLDAEKIVTLDLVDADNAALMTTDDGYGYVVMPLAKDGSR